MPPLLPVGASGASTACFIRNETPKDRVAKLVVAVLIPVEALLERNKSASKRAGKPASPELDCALKPYLQDS